MRPHVCPCFAIAVVIYYKPGLSLHFNMKQYRRHQKNMVMGKFCFFCFFVVYASKECAQSVEYKMVDTESRATVIWLPSNLLFKCHRFTTDRVIDARFSHKFGLHYLSAVSKTACNIAMMEVPNDSYGIYTWRRKKWLSMKKWRSKVYSVQEPCFQDEHRKKLFVLADGECIFQEHFAAIRLLDKTQWAYSQWLAVNFSIRVFSCRNSQRRKHRSR